MATIDERIEALEQRLKQEKAKRQKIEARKRTAEGKQRRAEDTRRKVLIGAAILAKLEDGQYTEERLRGLMDAFLTRPADRALFGLDGSEGSEAAS